MDVDTFRTSTGQPGCVAAAARQPRMPLHPILRKNSPSRGFACVWTGSKLSAVTGSIATCRVGTAGSLVIHSARKALRSSRDVRHSAGRVDPTRAVFCHPRRVPAAAASAASMSVVTELTAVPSAGLTTGVKRCECERGRTQPQHTCTGPGRVAAPLRWLGSEYAADNKRHTQHSSTQVCVCVCLCVCPLLLQCAYRRASHWRVACQASWRLWATTSLGFLWTTPRSVPALVSQRYQRRMCVTAIRTAPS